MKYTDHQVWLAGLVVGSPVAVWHEPTTFQQQPYLCFESQIILKTETNFTIFGPTGARYRFQRTTGLETSGAGNRILYPVEQLKFALE